MTETLSCKFSISGTWIAPLVREHDIYLMKAFMTLGLKDEYVQRLNYCQLYLQVCTLPDIATADGMAISDWA